MINILDKQDCCGCSACIQVCPKQCITMLEDKEGFLYPQVNTYDCIDCHLCEKVCPVLHSGKPRKPLNVYAAKNKDRKIRLQSSSGGVFSSLAEAIINAGGVVFGAKFDEEWKVVHGYTETKDGIADFRGSKYVQSWMGDNFSKVKYFLDNGRKVLFSGTPCQVAGLRSFLRRDYSSLITVDLVCHGVPSEKMLYDDIQKIVEKRKLHNYDLKVSFRCKKENEELKWGVFLTPSTNTTSGIIIGAEYPYDYYIAGFMCGLFYRECCYSCRYANPQRVSDITIGDYWGIGETFLDIGKGVSAVLLNTEKGICFFEQCKDSFEYEERELEEVIRGNGQLQYPSPKHKKHQLFRNLYPRLGFTRAVRRCLFSFYVRYYMIESVRNRLRRIPFIYRFYRSVKKFI